MTVIAIEEHWNLPELTSAVRALPDDRGDESIVLDELGDNLERLDERANDIAAEAVRRHPARLRAFATLPMADARRAAVELERTAGLGFVGAMVYGRTGATPLDDPRYDDLFAAAAALGQPIFIHPQIPPRAIREAAYSGFDPMTDLALATFGWGGTSKRRSRRYA